MAVLTETASCAETAVAAEGGDLEAYLSAQGVLILDGGLATWAERLGARLDSRLWSAGLLLDGVELLSRVHDDFLRAGADCIATASYQASFPGLAARGLGDLEAETAIRHSVRLARAARDDFWSSQPPARRRRPLVAASIGPYGAFLADGSEYRGRYDGLRPGDLRGFHRRRLHCLLDEGPDLVAFETIPNAMEVRVLVELLDESSSLPPAWLALSCASSSTLADGTALADLAVELDHPALAAVGVNCCPPSRVGGVLASLRAISEKPLVAYPNSGEGWTGGRWSGPVDSIVARACAWRRAGARLLGGCCRTTPDDIRALRAELMPG